ncbi:cytidine deaminase [Gloeophyllum trabeum ATCC 11539]|uniref:Cytidine deaminase n=1 Tax=Gloeophyllum trabeum (strain ATCC 11539 / FP-39264 / Madison 617) TaxID=670483 RepID=S7RNV7_GLOTA|nr:cytidine deaminase [Gloeophyllum trabeum ATCC 11539]EPQ56215.1 cytidine deaminase [Gloeophyllum trabeum ATCC 11539]
MAIRAWTLSMEDRDRLIRAAIEAKEGSYSPYSKFRVGAALLSASGEVIKGANVENASYGGTICAERTAIVKAVSEGTRSFVAIAVTSDVPHAISPCGICRQVLREFLTLSTPILLVPADYAARLLEGKEDGVVEATLEQLLPMSFGPEHLEMERGRQT